MGLTSSENVGALESGVTKQTAPITETSPTHHASHLLPDQPVVVIEPTKSWVGLNLKDLWAYRELLYFLAWRDIKVRYKQTALGVAWAIIQPLFTMFIFTLFFGRLAGISSDGIPYALFAYTGLLPWTFFANALTTSSNSLIGDSRLITKIYFPRMVIPIAAIGVGLVDFAIASVILVGLMFYYGVGLTLNILMVPPLVLLLTMLAMGVGMWMAAINIKYRDVRYALPFMIQLWMFASPIIYPTSLVPERLKWVLALNPLTGIIEGFRAALLGHRAFDWPTLAISAGVALVILVYSAFSFKRMEKSFADII